MDKILLTIFLSVLAGLFTAALSIVKLVNDKENKTTDYRQAWTDSLRKSFADLISNINLLASSIVYRLSVVDQANGIVEYKEALKESAVEGDVNSTENSLERYLDKKLIDEDAHIRDLRKELYKSYSLTRLHFKPNDLSFSRVEQKFDVIIEMLEKLPDMRGEKNESERLLLRQKIHSATAEITGYSRDILKTEWEAVKKGEGAYQKTKTWSFVSGAIALFIILIFGIVTAWSLLRSDGNEKNNKFSNKEEKIYEIKPSEAIYGLKGKEFPMQNNNQIISIYSEERCFGENKIQNAQKSKIKNLCVSAETSKISN